MTQASAREIDEAAAEWAVRREQLGSDPDFAAELERWLSADPRRAGALLRAEATLSFLGEAQVPAKSSRRSVPLRARRRFLAGAAASVAGVVAGVAVWRQVLAPSTVMRTQLGQVARRPLADGSVATINTDSIIDVAFKRDERHVTLSRGEAWFQVAKDPGRPFVVRAGAVQVRAVGTAFSVRLLPDGADVLVTEGVVEVWREGQEGGRIRVAKGQKAQAIADRVTVVDDVAETIDKDLAWRAGEIALYGQTVAEAAAQFNRFNSRKIRVNDAGLAGEKVVGQFSATDPGGFARAAAATLGARVRTQDDVIILDRPAA